MEGTKSKSFDNSPVTSEELQIGIVDWAESITDASLAVRELQDSLAGKDATRTRNAIDRLGKAAVNLDKYLISRGV